jgi:hypothetical protein
MNTEIEMYRKQNGCLFKFSEAHHAYLQVYRNDLIRTLSGLIAAYEREEYEENEEYED